jgi:hypothetical protein
VFIRFEDHLGRAHVVKARHVVSLDFDGGAYPQAYLKVRGRRYVIGLMRKVAEQIEARLMEIRTCH